MDGFKTLKFSSRSGKSYLHEFQLEWMVTQQRYRAAWAQDNLKGPWRITTSAPYLEASLPADQAMIVLRWSGE